MAPGSTGSAAPTTKSASASPGTRPASRPSRMRRRRSSSSARPASPTTPINFPRCSTTCSAPSSRWCTGYPGGNDINLAMERGEVQGRCSFPWSTVKATHQALDRREEGQPPDAVLARQARRPAERAAGHGSRQDRRAAADPQADLRPAGDGTPVTRRRPVCRRIASMRCARPSWTRWPTRISGRGREGEIRDHAGSGAEIDKAKLEITAVPGEKIESLVQEIYRTTPPPGREGGRHGEVRQLTLFVVPAQSGDPYSSGACFALGPRLRAGRHRV